MGTDDDVKADAGSRGRRNMILRKAEPVEIGTLLDARRCPSRTLLSSTATAWEGVPLACPSSSSSAAAATAKLLLLISLVLAAVGEEVVALMIAIGMRIIEVAEVVVAVAVAARMTGGRGNEVDEEGGSCMLLAVRTFVLYIISVAQ